MKRLLLSTVLLLVLSNLLFAGRYYDAATGRFLQIDPHASKYPSLSPYSFVANNPLKFIDPNGKEIKFAKNVSRKDASNHKANLKRMVTGSKTMRKLIYNQIKSKSITTVKFSKKMNNPGQYKTTSVNKDGSAKTGEITFSKKDSHTNTDGEVSSSNAGHEYKHSDQAQEPGGAQKVNNSQNPNSPLHQEAYDTGYDVMRELGDYESLSDEEKEEYQNGDESEGIPSADEVRKMIDQIEVPEEENK